MKSNFIYDGLFGLSGILYGMNAIPFEWRDVLARKNDIEVLCHKLTLKYSPEN